MNLAYDCIDEIALHIKNYKDLCNFCSINKKLNLKFYTFKICVKNMINLIHKNHYIFRSSKKLCYYQLKKNHFLNTFNEEKSYNVIKYRKNYEDIKILLSFSHRYENVHIFTHLIIRNNKFICFIINKNDKFIIKMM